MAHHNFGGGGQSCGPSGHHGHHGNHGHHGGHSASQFGHPDQSPSWNSALQGIKENSAVYSAPSTSITPILGALLVFAIMSFALIINWEAFIPVNNGPGSTPLAPLSPAAQTYAAPPGQSEGGQANESMQSQRYRVWTDR